MRRGQREHVASPVGAHWRAGTRTMCRACRSGPPSRAQSRQTCQGSTKVPSLPLPAHGPAGGGGRSNDGTAHARPAACKSEWRGEGGGARGRRPQLPTYLHVEKKAVGPVMAVAVTVRVVAVAVRVVAVAVRVVAVAMAVRLGRAHPPRGACGSRDRAPPALAEHRRAPRHGVIPEKKKEQGKTWTSCADRGNVRLFISLSFSPFVRFSFFLSLSLSFSFSLSLFLSRSAFSPGGRGARLISPPTPRTPQTHSRQQPDEQEKERKRTRKRVRVREQTRRARKREKETEAIERKNQEQNESTPARAEQT